MFWESVLQFNSSNNWEDFPSLDSLNGRFHHLTPLLLVIISKYLGEDEGANT